MKLHSQILMLTLVTLPAVFVGCEGPMGSVEGKGSPLVLPAEEDSAGYLDRLSDQNTVSENDAMRGILLLLDEKDDAKSFDERRQILLERGVVSGKWSFQKDRPITRGKFAYMIYQAIKLPGGVILTVGGPNQRYCLRELEYRQFMAQGFILAPVTGMEYVGVLTRADAYRRTGKLPEEVALEEE
ncbi:MAG: hypothetical protein JXA11_04890 [Phycisphaerae bacterium]|nr:hypothetical protein [Phycisphaerae bacterium]